MRLLIPVLACIPFATFAAAQNGESPGNRITAGIGPAIPAGDAANYVKTAPLLKAGQGYPFSFGGRYAVPSPFRQIGFSDRGSAVNFHYPDTVPSNGYFSGCYTCSSRGGWGSYGPGNASYFFGKNHKFHAGTTYEFVAASTDAQAVGSVPAARSGDRWSNLFLEFGLSF
jgi:hypothetical protein